MNTILSDRCEPSAYAQSSAATERLLAGGVFALALLLNFHAIGWGLPNGNETWANDAIRPGAPLSILHRLFVAEPWNSGWFWFKYPLGHVLILGTAYAPYLAWLALTGGLASPTSEYPHGFADPEAALMALAVLGRSVSALMGSGCAVIAYAALVRSFGRSAALAGGMLTALCYPILYYSHTTNVEVPYLFWLLLAFLAAVRLMEGPAQMRWWLVLGLGAAMSVSTKELGAGFFIAFPPVLLLARMVRRDAPGTLLKGVFVAALVSAVVIVIANDVFLNPTGFARRIGFLTHRLEPEVALRYAPYYFPIEFGEKGLSAELAHLAKTGERIVTSLSLPTALLALAGLLIAIHRKPWWALLAIASCTTFYVFGARAMLSLSVRYVLPITALGAIAAGIAIGALLDARRASRLARVAAVASLAWAAAYGVDVNRMLASDGRYAAEEWLARNASPGDVVEVYQRPTYLPRFPAMLRVDEVPFNERTIEGLLQRKPEWVVLSSAGLSGVSVEYRRDWKEEEEASEGWMPSQIAPDGTIMNYKRGENIELLQGILDERLGYRRVARFVVDPWVERTMIQSLNPMITIYAREQRVSDDTSTADAELRARGIPAAGGLESRESGA